MSDMTKEKSIDILKSIKAGFETDEWMKEDVEAVEKGIKALENQNTLQEELQKIKAEIKEWYWQSDKQELAKDPCVVDAMTDLFCRTIDKHISELKEMKEENKMKLVIEIKDSNYNWIKEHKEGRILPITQNLYESVREGIPLDDFLKQRKEPIDENVVESYLKKNKQ